MSVDYDFKRNEKKAYRFAILFFSLLLVFVVGSIFIMKSNFFSNPSEPKVVVINPIKKEVDEIKNGIHVRTGLIDAEGLMSVVNN